MLGRKGMIETKLVHIEQEVFRLCRREGVVELDVLVDPNHFLLEGPAFIEWQIAHGSPKQAYRIQTLNTTECSTG